MGLLASLNRPLGVKTYLKTDQVKDSEDIARVLGLPRRPRPSLAEQIEMAKIMTRRLGIIKSTPCRCAALSPRGCITELLPVQGWYLYEASERKGAMGHIIVGGGKCLARGAEVFDAISGMRRDISEIRGPLSVPSLVGGELHSTPAVGFPSGEKPCWRVTLADGSYLDASFDHPILTPNGWKRAADLCLREFVAVPRRIPAPQVSTEVSADEVTLLALLMADGGLNGATARFTNATPAVISKFMGAAIRVCGGWAEEASGSHAREFTLLDSKVFREKWGLYGLAKDKRLHPTLWGLSSEHVRLFVNLFWACDGHISNRGVELTLASEKLIDDLRFLLLRLGVRTRKAEKVSTCEGQRFPAWRISARGEAALKFLTEVGDVLGKEDACKGLRASLENTSRNTNYDVVPIGLPEFYEICIEMKWPGKVKGGPRGKGLRGAAFKLLHPTVGQYVSRERFSRFCREFNYSGKYGHLCQPDVCWERVESLLPLGELPVFDLNVPGSHNFVTNGVIVHNTGIDVLLAMVVPGAQRALLLIPPSLRAQFALDFECWSQHFKTPNLSGGASFYPGRPTLEVVAYSELSNRKFSTWLETYRPDIIIADEAQHLKDRNSVRTDRLLRYYIGLGAASDDVKFFPHSGSLTTRSPDDFAHLSALSLREGSPLPIASAAVQEWSLALAPSNWDEPMGPGALNKFCISNETVREGFRRRLVETPGVITTEDAMLDAKLVMGTRAVTMPGNLLAMVKEVRRSKERPDGEVLVEDSEVAAACKQLVCGFYYRWIYPRKEPLELIEEWFAARQNWNRELREKLCFREANLDSPALCEEAAIRYVQGYNGPLPTWDSDTYAAWAAIRKQVLPEQETVWVDDFLAQDAVRWAKEGPGIVWYSHAALGERLSKLGIARFGGGKAASEEIIKESGTRSIAASMKAHGTGKNMQAFNRNLIAGFPEDWEQLLGRTHRYGQTKDVKVWVYSYALEFKVAMEKSVSYSEYIHQTTGKTEKLLFASWTK